MANNNISLRFRISEDGSDNFTFNNINPIASVAILENTLKNGRYVTFNNFKLYRENITKEVKEHMDLNSNVRNYFLIIPTLMKYLSTL